MTYKVRSLRKPAYPDELITNYEQTRSLRSSDKELLTEPRTRTMIASRAFRVAAPRTWHGLPLKVGTAPSIDTFCSTLKTHLFDIAYTTSHLEDAGASDSMFLKFARHSEGHRNMAPYKFGLID